MNDNPNTSWPASMNDAQGDLPEHFNWGALALQRPRSVPATATGPAYATSGRRGPDFWPGTGLASVPDEPGTAAAGAIDPAPEAPTVPNDAGPLRDAAAAERSIAIDRAPLPLAPLRRPPLPLPKDGILRLGFSDVGEPSEPGEHLSLYGPVDITRSDLAVWRAYPEAVFTVIQPSPYANASIFRLGTFEV
ncbi:hypothetical protein [Bradyrhizobium stylosanthis]|uniref:hypothetical protein n=1 Tax=Bradyrhizobium stylosanthis TaxID=1803665 RepID=UPI0009ED6B49|nr:hypothetical protein [Bradyrhizobium stylosanthis]